MHVTEIRVAALAGIAVPDNVTEGDTLMVIAHVVVSRVDTEQIDVTGFNADHEHLPGSTTIETVMSDAHVYHLVKP